MAQNKTHLILVPGLICDQEIWAYVQNHLSEVAICQTVPADEADNMQDLAKAVLKNAPETFAIAGFSMGGYIALEVFRQAPTRVTHLALMDTSSRVDTVEKAAARTAAIADCEGGRFEDLLNRFVPQLLHPDCIQGPLESQVLEMGYRIGPELFARRHKAMLTRTDGREILAQSNIPVRAIVGRSDTLSSIEEHQEIAELASYGHCSIIEDCGHMPPLDQPQAATAVLRDWLLKN